MVDSLERGAAAAALQGLLTDATNGKGMVALVSGPVATGKSSLLYSFAERSVGLGVLSLEATASHAERNLPLGVLRQLVGEVFPLAEDGKHALKVLDAEARSILASDPPVETVDQLDPHFLDVLYRVLIEVSEQYPLMILVDDVHHADRVSLLCLVYLARRFRFARVMLVASRLDHGGYDEAFFWTELLRQPNCRHIALAPLSPAAVLNLAVQNVGQETAERFAAQWYPLTGGNPILLEALLEDHRDARRRGRAAAEPVVGARYGEAVVSCFQRAGEDVLRAARALAVSGEPDALGPMLGIGPADRQPVVQALLDTGPVTSDGFRHEVGRAYVLNDLDSGERAGLYGRAAELAYAGGAHPTKVVDLLLQAGDARGSWALPVLEDAAWQALREGRVNQAVDCLKLARRSCADERRRAGITTALARAEWRINPELPTGRLTELTDASRLGLLHVNDAVVVARILLWHGRFDEARDVLERLAGPDGGNVSDTAAELLIARPWLRSAHPPFLADLPPAAASHSVKLSVPEDRRLGAVKALASVLTRGPHPDTVGTVERTLRNGGLESVSLDTVECSLLALVYGGRPDKAVPWCDRFLTEAESRGAPARQARLAAIRAEAAVRLGDLPGAERYARLALEIVPPTAWGVALGIPLGALVLSQTEMGRFDDADKLLDQPVRQQMFQTRYGLHYLYARGRYSLATGQMPLALRDFAHCGELMNAWGLDAPGLVPWRLGAAEAYLRMGDLDRVRQLTREQSVRAGAKIARVHGILLRLTAAVAESRNRPLLLRQAADLLQSPSGDRYELARVLTELTQAHHSMGKFRMAGIVRRQAQALAEDCRAEPLRRAVAGEPDDDLGPLAQKTEPMEFSTVLSDAEKRVAALAASGYANRDIADQLFISVSTVEQHLTRTYRKLGITRRSELLTSLEISGQSPNQRAPVPSNAARPASRSSCR